MKKKQNLSSNPERGGHGPLGVECQFCFAKIQISEYEVHQVGPKDCGSFLAFIATELRDEYLQRQRRKKENSLYVEI
jgi:hypothetical protein